MAIYYNKDLIVPNIDIDIIHNKLMVSNNNLLKKSWLNFISNLYSFDKNYNSYLFQQDYFGKLFFLNNQLSIIKNFNTLITNYCNKSIRIFIINKLINPYKNKIKIHLTNLIK